MTGFSDKKQHCTRAFNPRALVHQSQCSPYIAYLGTETE